MAMIALDEHFATPWSEVLYISDSSSLTRASSLFPGASSGTFDQQEVSSRSADRTLPLQLACFGVPVLVITGEAIDLAS